MSRRNGPSPILMLAPLAFVMIGYNYLYHFPQQRELAAVKEKLSKLRDGRDAVEHQFGHVTQDIAGARKQRDALQETLEQADAELTAAQTEQTAFQQRLVQSRDPAESIDRVLSLFGTVGLVVLESQGEAGAAGRAHEALDGVMKLVGKPNDQSGSELGRGTYEIRVAGTFADVRKALETVVRDFEHVVLLGAELESVEVDAPAQRWKITLLV